MPFANTGVYTPPAAAESAFPGKVIASADWNAVFTDLSNALTTLGQQNWTNSPRIINSGGNVSVATTDTVIMVQASAPTITLPLSSTKLWPVKIMGAATGIFSSHNSTIQGTGGETISGQANFVANLDYQCMTLYPLASGGYIISFA